MDEGEGEQKNGGVAVAVAPLELSHPILSLASADSDEAMVDAEQPQQQARAPAAAPAPESKSMSVDSPAEANPVPAADAAVAAAAAAAMVEEEKDSVSPMQITPLIGRASPSPTPASAPTAPASGSNGNGFPFGDPRERPYSHDEATTTQVKWVYRAVNFLTDLFFGVDKDLDHLPTKRKSVVPSIKTGTAMLEPSVSYLPPSISAGYGELSWQGFDKLLNYMQNVCPSDYRLDSTSRFLDIGSGFGKCVLHAKLRCKIARSVGIECIKTRHEKALEALHLLRAGFVPGLSDAKDAPEFATVRDLDLSGCELFEGDITLSRFHPLVHTATHIYAFDVVFSKDTHAKILPLIEQCNFKLFGCYLGPSKLAAFGLTQLQLLHSIKVNTTGKQSFTCYFYIKAANANSNVAAAAAAAGGAPSGLAPPSRESPLDPTQDPDTDAFYQNIRDQAPTTPDHVLHANAMTAAAAAAAAAGGTAAAAAAEQAAQAKLNTKKLSSSPPPSAAATEDAPAKRSNKKRAYKRKSAKEEVEEEAEEEAEEEEEEDDSASNRAQLAVTLKAKAAAAAAAAKRALAVAQAAAAAAEAAAVAAAAVSSSSSSSSRPAAAAKAPKPLSRSKLFDLSMEAAIKSKSSGAPRRTNNSLVLKLDPTVAVSQLPRDLQHYLTDAPKQNLKAKQIQLEQDQAPIMLEKETHAVGAAPAAAAPATAAATSNGGSSVATPSSTAATAAPDAAAAAPAASITDASAASLPLHSANAQPNGNKSKQQKIAP